MEMKSAYFGGSGVQIKSEIISLSESLSWARHEKAQTGLAVGSVPPLQSLGEWPVSRGIREVTLSMGASGVIKWPA